MTNSTSKAMAKQPDILVMDKVDRKVCRDECGGPHPQRQERGEREKLGDMAGSERRFGEGVGSGKDECPPPVAIGELEAVTPPPKAELERPQLRSLSRRVQC